MKIIKVIKKLLDITQKGWKVGAEEWLVHDMLFVL